MNKIVDKCKLFCTGCGLCISQEGIEMKIDSKGFPSPCINEHTVEFCKGICPALGNPVSNNETTVWGSFKKVCYGWAENSMIRKAASSGGSLTALCIYLLNSKKVDGIIQIRANEEFPYATDTVISRTEKDILSCMGSRYSISFPLANLFELIKPDEKYAFVGKPCDVVALRAYMNKKTVLKKSIVYLLSFFCAGMPSVDAQKKLLKELEVEGKCKNLQYRGNGWPGSTKAIDFYGNIHFMSYERAWGNILGRDVRNSCRFCFDGIGLAADIVCGDAWYLKDDNIPDFSEHEGRNIIFARTGSGMELLGQCIKENILCVDKADINDLRYMQEYQYERRATMISQVIGLCLAGKPLPEYSCKSMFALSRKIGMRKQLGRFKGVFLRCKRGVI